uniref:Uncharacterized protein n=1 Tax=Chenopodium quinoa TaxID=63459 RepID=A0A803MDV3_CHEQI
MLRIIIFVIFLVCGVLVKGEPKVPCYFIFGDSLSDVGNNNNLRTMVKANYPPYGVDFPGGVPTGRFTNNRTIEDYISTYLGFDKTIAPYKDLMGQDILRGVNFASGSGGILMETGAQLTLYITGARKFAIFGIGNLGCIPSQIIRNNATGCVDEINQAANMFNTKLKSLVDELNAMLPGAKFTLISLSNLQALSPLPAGINSNSTCCKLRSDFQCEPYSTPCANRDLYAFFDGFHPTDVINGGVAEAAYSSPDRRIANPMNINELTSNQQGKATHRH